MSDFKVLIRADEATQGFFGRKDDNICKMSLRQVRENCFLLHLLSSGLLMVMLCRDSLLLEFVSPLAWCCPSW